MKTYFGFTKSYAFLECGFVQKCLNVFLNEDVNSGLKKVRLFRIWICSPEVFSRVNIAVGSIKYGVRDLEVDYSEYRCCNR